jgi:hypothetical protein
MKKNKIVFWFTTGFLFLFEGIMPLSAIVFAPQAATEGTVYLGYPKYFAYILISFKVLGATALMVSRLPRRIKEWAYAGLGFNFICASISHFVIDGAKPVSFFPLVMLILLAISYTYNFEITFSWQRQTIKQ